MPSLRHSFEKNAPNLDDCIGVESCVDWVPGENFDGIGRSSCHDDGDCGGSISIKGRWRRSEKIQKLFPPPLPWLARTENLYSFMKRRYADDGSLVLVEEKVQRKDYLQADRSNGRLTLRLVPFKHKEDFAADEDADGGVETNYVDGEVLGSDGEEGDDPTVAEEEEKSTMTNLGDGSCVGNGVALVDNDGGGRGGGGKIYRHCNQSRNSCMLGGGGVVVVASVRSVHT